MRRGQQGVTVLRVEAGSGTGAQGIDWHERETLRALGVAPVREGWYIVTIEKVGETRAREVLAEREAADSAPVCTCDPTPAMRAASIHRSSCPRIGGDGS